MLSSQTNPPPTLSPVQPPTKQLCAFNLSFDCVIVGNEVNSGKACTAPDTGVVPCRDRPTALTMLLNGGDCEQSDNRQFLMFSCTDRNGGPPKRPGDEVHVLVTDTIGSGIVYFDGIVRVGELYPLTDGGRRFETDQAITISTPDRSTVLQEAQYQTTCNNNLELKNRFGASQVVGFFNDEQGNVTCFSQFELSLSLDLPDDVAQDRSVELGGLTVNTNFAGAIDLSSQISGQMITPDGNVVVVLEGSLDLSSRRSYTLLYSFQGIARPENILCNGSGVLTFDAGQPAPVGVPTTTPTIPPSVSPAPTPDRAEATCSMQALVVCEVLREGRAQAPCNTIQDPAMAICTDDERPSLLSFIYNAEDGAPDTAVITVEGEMESQTFQVRDGQTFTAEMQFGNSADITIQDYDDYEVHTRCNGRTDVFLGNTIGPLTLVGYETGIGLFASAFEIRNTYVILVGPLDAILESAVIDSAFSSSPFAAASEGVSLKRNSRTIVHQEITTIDVTDKFAQGILLDFTMDVTARTSYNDRACTATDTYRF